MKQPTPGLTRALARLGGSLRTARIRRRLSQKDMASLMGVSIGTVQRIERGDPGVAIGSIAMEFLCLNSLDKLASVLDPSVDELGAAADSLRLPKRVRSMTTDSERRRRSASSSEPIAF
ncbi:MAG: helix-turn-helix transcriptional regulator [Gammaproteobacteria bacterium]|nr:helix-turn-helix transcriptional regulator [Gammaproteobacteria bacterium]